MAAHERLHSKAPIAHFILTDQLAKVLTKGVSFKVYHVSTPPSRCSALYSALPGERPERTYCESHFLAVSITTGPDSVNNEAQETSDVLVFAIEVLIYSTAYSTTLFVSKADSTGYLNLLKLPKGSPSPLKDISATFLSHLVERRKRPGIRSIVSLFARAQGQYLFPGSSDNGGKHVLDDRGLIRWWCGVLNPLVAHTRDTEDNRADDQKWKTIHGYLKVPGLEDHDVRAYLPKASSTSVDTAWMIGHPLQNLSRYQTHVPPRCLVPRFPDDPKSRFLEELDDELSTSQGKVGSGEWKSVKSLDQFWEMMAFRQECSAGRLVGFIWVVFEPHGTSQAEDPEIGDSQTSMTSLSSDFVDDEDTVRGAPHNLSDLITPNTSFAGSSQLEPTSSPHKIRISAPRSSGNEASIAITPTHKKRKLTGPIYPRQPRVKTKNRIYALERPQNTAYYTWPPEGRGQVVLEEKDYTRVTELLLRLDFTNIELARGSTGRWINEVRSGQPGNDTGMWGAAVTGTKPFEAKSDNGTMGVRTLNVGLVRKKRKV